MSAQVSRTVVDSLEFARAGQTLRGSLPVEALTRLHDSLYDTVGQVDFVVQGDGGFSPPTKYGPVIIPSLEFGR